MAQSNQESDKMLDLYIFDYLVKKKVYITAKSFLIEGEVSPEPLETDDSPGGFLLEWWYVFWVKFIARYYMNLKHSVSAAAIIKAQQGRVKEHQMRRWDYNHPSLRSPMNYETSLPLESATNNYGLDGYIFDYLVKKKLFDTAKWFMREGKVSHEPVAIDVRGGFLLEWWCVFWDIFIARTKEKHSESAAAAYIEAQQGKAKEHQIQQNQFIRQPQMQRRDLDLPSIRSPVNAIIGFDAMFRQLNAMNSETSQPNIDARMAQLILATNRHGGQIVHQGGLSPAMHQIQSRAQQTHETKSEVNPSTINSQGSLPVIENDGLNPGVSGFPLKGWPLTVQKSSMQNQSDFQPSPLQQQQQILAQVQAQENVSDSSMYGDNVPPRFTGLPRGNMNPKDGQQNANNESTESPMQSSSPKNNCKRKRPPSSGPANSTGTRNTVIGSSTNQLPQDDMEQPEDVGSLEDNAESTVTREDETPKHNSFSFSEAGSLRSESKVTCCNFSSDGKLLASAGHDKKVYIWNMETLETGIAPKRHSHNITDVRFRPNSTQLATSSYDKTIKIWDASNPGYYLRTIISRASPVMSLDFHPKSNELLCSCDSNNDLRLWNVDTSSCVLLSKWASTQVRFQPREGKLLAAVSEDTLSIVDVETNTRLHVLKEREGESSKVHYVCWNHTGEMIASVGKESVKIWSLGSGKCIHELSFSGGKRFKSCVFHPNLHNLLVVGGYKEVELWNTTENKVMSIPGHECVICAMDKSDLTGTIASASHDSCVKIWK